MRHVNSNRKHRKPLHFTEKYQIVHTIYDFEAHNYYVYKIC